MIQAADESRKTWSNPSGVTFTNRVVVLECFYIHEVVSFQQVEVHCLFIGVNMHVQVENFLRFEVLHMQCINLQEKKQSVQ